MNQSGAEKTGCRRSRVVHSFGYAFESEPLVAEADLYLWMVDHRDVFAQSGD